jgi:hypothetical protein
MLDSPTQKSFWIGPVQVNLGHFLSVVLVWALLSVAVPSIFFFGYGGSDWWRSRSADPAKCQSCECMWTACWDGKFKGNFSPHGFKTVWFNMDAIMVFIVLDLIVYIALAIEMVKFVIAVFLSAKPSWKALACVALLLYPNFYSFWMVFNYLNDRNWALIDNQMFFGLTEMMAMWCCVLVVDSSRPTAAAQRARYWVASVALAHFCLAIVDQWRDGYFLIAASSHQRLRDFFFLLPEVVRNENGNGWFLF